MGLTDLKQDMAIQKEETFGPVVAIAGFDGTDVEAVRLSNDTQYGLTGCVYSKDLERATRVSQHVKAGQVGINSNPIRIHGARVLVTSACGTPAVVAAWIACDGCG